MEDTSKIRVILTIAWELFQDESNQSSVASSFISYDCVEIFLILVQKYKNGSIGKLSLKAIINIVIESDNGKQWLEKSYEPIYEIVKGEDDLNKILITKDNIWVNVSLKIFCVP